MGGEGHIFDMNKRLEQNRALRTSIRKKETQQNHHSHQKTKLHFKQVSKDKLELILSKIQAEAKKDRKKTVLLSIGITLFLFLSIVLISIFVL